MCGIRAYDRPTEICVTASDQNDQLPSYANYGSSTVDLAAPGDNIYSTLRHHTYGYISGSSMASAQVSGAAALILSVQNMSPTALKADILGNVQPLPSLTGRVRTGGELDVCAAISRCSPAIITSLPHWTFSDRRAYTSVEALKVTGVIAGTSLVVTCHGRGCPFATRTTTVLKRPCCVAKSTRRCSPSVAVSLLPIFHRARLSIGSKLTLSILQCGWIGKKYSFTVRSNRQPEVRRTKVPSARLDRYLRC